MHMQRKEENDTTLLDEALQNMHILRQRENLKVTSFYNCLPFNSSNDNNTPVPSSENIYVQQEESPYEAECVSSSPNTLHINIFLLDPFLSHLQQKGMKRTTYNTTTTTTHSSPPTFIFQKQIHQGLCKVYTLIQKELFPSYSKLQFPKYHSWFIGGQGLYEGFGLQYINHGDMKQEDVLHLHGCVYYGSHPYPDQWYTIALAHQLSNDLLKKYNIHVAIECWDGQDGQILLIESSADNNYDNEDYHLETSSDFPSWINDSSNSMMEHNTYHKMKRRVYVMQGDVYVIHPSSSIMNQKTTTSSLQKGFISTLSRSESLWILAQQYMLQQSTIISSKSLKGRIDPFLKVLQGGSMASSQLQHSTRSTIQNTSPSWLHTAAIILPQTIAQIIHVRPDLIPCAIHSFCIHGPWKLGYRMNEKLKDTREDSSFDYYYFPFENLLITKMTVSKTLYSMLLTGGGDIVPPMKKIPSHYKSIESNRIRKQYTKQKEDIDVYFRHAFECGVRLSLGFEWLMSSSPSSLHRHPSFPRREGISMQDRIQYHASIHTMAGGNHDWIQQAWKLGPNVCNKDDDISDLVHCPMYDLEIRHGGISPISYPYQSVSLQIQQVLRQIESSMNVEEEWMMFPVPLIDELDSDTWMDDMDKQLELESSHYMNHLNTFNDSNVTLPVRIHSDSEMMTPGLDTNENELKKLFQTESCLNDTKEIQQNTFEQTISTDTIIDGMEIKEEEAEEEEDLCIDSQVFLSMMFQVLQMKDIEE